MTTRIVATIAAGIARGLRAMLGAPDYERYLAHTRVHHSGHAPMTRDEFMQERLNNRYNKIGARCC